MAIPRIGLTTGEPAGIGPDLAIMLAQFSFAAEIVILGDCHLLSTRAKQLGLPFEISRLDFAQIPQPGFKLLDVPLIADVISGQLNTSNARYVLNLLEIAGLGCLNHEFSALVTCPIHKSIINSAGIPFRGHTEFLADLTSAESVLMCLTTGQLRIAVLTTHIPLREVATAITNKKLEQALWILHHALQTYFAIPQPRIAVCGLNPHAGEGGYLGTEEIKIIQPVLQKLQNQGLHLLGPLAADTAFLPARIQQTDAYLTLYHDQGLPVLKYAGFGQAVNITLGLPIIRTSVDHGTALELAATGRADVGSLKAAIETAIDMVKMSNHL